MSNSNPNNKSSFQSMREWIVEHKLRAVDLIIVFDIGDIIGTLWLSGIAGSIAYNWSQPGMKTSVRIIHARLHAQALTLAALAGAAVVEYYDHKSGAKSERYAKFLPLLIPTLTKTKWKSLFVIINPMFGCLIIPFVDFS
ncbi:hypothetical protein OSB04_016770 [Centaurea solstitialis]|uniref:HIG1 domain-containing protein n=1 Tax=Centaurea solstitialis TaxID=347529 RepID=A0AA38WHS3_9ASTR|nr:hypothetical protein OSB04_016770 [Centaurea solstitialis]